MKKINKFLSGAAIALISVFALSFSGPVLAQTGEGEIEGGNIYRVRNVTDGGDFTDPVSADACETLQYKVRIHDPGPAFLSQVHVRVDLPAGESNSNTSTVTVSAQNADPSSTSDTATVNLSSSQSVSYVNGSTQLLDPSGNVISSLPDGITGGGSGISIGNVGVSIEQLRFVQFKTKVSCPTPPEKPSEKPVTPAAAAPTSLPVTGPGDVAAAFVGISTASGAAYHFIRRRLGL